MTPASAETAASATPAGAGQPGTGRAFDAVFGAWQHANRADLRALSIYERHYSAYQYADGRKRRQFVGPGECLVLLTATADALFVWRLSQFRADNQSGIECAVFRNESTRRSSDLIRTAMVAAADRWPDERRLFTYVNAAKVKSANPGYCFKMAGWRNAGVSRAGLVTLEYTFADAAPEAG